MPKGLGPIQCNEIERSGVIPEECKFLNPTLHFCPDQSGLLIDEADPEFDHCHCFKKDE